MGFHQVETVEGEAACKRLDLDQRGCTYREITAEMYPYNSEPMPANVRLLIVGTAPPPRFSNPQCEGGRAHKLDFNFFHGSGHNNMWLWLNQIAADQGMVLPNDGTGAQEYRKSARDYLERNRLWMKDVLQTYRRKSGHECSSSDDDIIKPLPGECINFVELPMRRLKRLVDIQPDHRFGYSMGNDTLDWYFELGDLIIDEVVIRDVFRIDEKEDIT